MQGSWLSVDILQLTVHCMHRKPLCCAQSGKVNRYVLRVLEYNEYNKSVSYLAD